VPGSQQFYNVNSFEKIFERRFKIEHLFNDLGETPGEVRSCYYTPEEDRGAIQPDPKMGSVVSGGFSIKSQPQTHGSLIRFGTER
jgi:hypothetical protein